jgi:hypothetical protein
MLIPAGVEHYIEPTGSETVENIDVFVPAGETTCTGSNG